MVDLHGPVDVLAQLLVHVTVLRPESLAGKALDDPRRLLAV